MGPDDQAVSRWEWRVHGTRGHWDVRAHCDDLWEFHVITVGAKETAEWLTTQLNTAYRLGEGR